MILVIGGCGYIGSAICCHLRDCKIQFDSIDLEWFGNPGGNDNRKIDYRSLTAMELAKYSHIIFLAAHSSVKMVMEHPAEAFYNNVLGFKQLLEKITPKQQLVYASSASVYNGVAENAVNEQWPNFVLGNMYDFSKYSNDCFARYSGCDYISLRFGTVNGSSPNFRTDLIINRMVLTALRDGKVYLANPHVHRPILVMSDLVRAIEYIIRRKPPSGIYNLASFNSTVFKIGEYIASRLNVNIDLLPNSSTYDFSVNADQIMKTTGIVFNGTLEAVVDDLISYFRSNGICGCDR